MILVFEHKKVGNLNKSPIILGGVYITLSLILLLDKNYEILKFFCILMLFLGLLSDKNYLSNPITRLILQILILSIFIFFTELSIRSVSINFLDNLLKLKIINIIFTIFVLLFF